MKSSTDETNTSSRATQHPDTQDLPDLAVVTDTGDPGAGGEVNGAGAHGFRAFPPHERTPPPRSLTLLHSLPGRRETTEADEMKKTQMRQRD